MPLRSGIEDVKGGASQDELNLWARKGRLIIAFLNEAMPFPPDSSGLDAEEIDMARQDHAESTGLTRMTPEELESRWLETHDSLPVGYDSTTTM